MGCARTGWIDPRNAPSVLDRCERFDDSPSVLSCPRPWLRCPSWRATCAGRGTRRRRTSSPPIDPALWLEVNRDPVRLLGAVGRERLDELVGDEDFLGRLDAATPTSSATSPSERWYARKAGDDAPALDRLLLPGVRHHRRCCRSTPAASASSPATTSRPSSDLGIPLVGVGLFYRHGYFKQALYRDGWQQESYPVLDPDELPLTAAPRGRRQSRATSRSRCPTAPTWSPASSWRSVGRVPLLLLDTDIEENSAHYRDVTDRLYGGNSEHRLRQELLLGVGGVRALRVWSRITGAPAPEVFHTNEGHAGFLGIERIRELTVGEGGPHLDFDTALEVSRAGTVFTTHTPVPAGIDRFPRELVAAVLRRQLADPRRPRRAGARPRRRGLRGRRRRRLQHGRDGLPPRPARQRRLPAARPRQPRHVQRPVARLRRGRGADQLDHQRRPRPDLDRARGHRARRRAAAPTSTATTPTRCGRWSTRSATARSGTSSARCAPASSRTPAAGCARSAAKRGFAPAELDLDRQRPRPRRADHRLRAPRADVQAAHADAARPGPPQEAAARPRAPDPAGHRRQGAPGRRDRQAADPGDGALRRRPGDPAPHRLPAQLRHRDGAAALPRLRRLAQQPAAPLRGLRHVGHEGRAQRRPQPLHPRRLVGRVVRRQQRLGDPVGRRHRRRRPP